MVGKGSPLQKKLKGNIDDLYLDSSCALLWIKERDAGKVTGWRCLGHVVPAETGGVGVISHPRDPRLAGIRTRKGERESKGP
jgi:hypothetical protein